MSWRLRMISAGLACLLLAGLLALPPLMPTVSEWANKSSVNVTVLASGVAWCSVGVTEMQTHTKCYPAAGLRRWLP